MKRAIVVLGCSAYIVACHKEARLAVLPAPHPRVVDPALDPLKHLPDLPPAGVPEIAGAQLPPVLQTKVPAQPPPHEPRRRVRQTAATGNSVSVVEPETSPVTSVPLPRLGQILSAEEKRVYEGSINENLEAVRGSLARISVKRLTPKQQGTYRQIQVFVRQAEALRRSDLLSAIGMAQKAKLLARELAASQAR